MDKIKDTKVYNILDYLNWFRQNELDLKPRYQRNPVWDLKAKSYLIDTIIRGLPIPQIFIRQIIDTRTMKSKREVVDGFGVVKFQRSGHNRVKRTYRRSHARGRRHDSRRSGTGAARARRCSARA